MKKKINLLFSFLVMLCFMVCLGVNASAAEIAATGQCGDDVYWNYNSETGELVISGTGAMYEYSCNESPFYDNDDIKTVVIEEGVTTVSCYMFYNCDGITEITISDSVISIGLNAFHNTAYSSNSDNWENDMLYIGNHLITAQTSISGDYVIKNGTLTIADRAFNACMKLTSLTIPESVRSIGESVVAQCTNLTNISVDENNEYYSNDSYGVLFNKDKSQLIAVPNAIKETSYEIPNGVTSIDVGAFYYCVYIESIKIPDSVTTIGDYAFNSCYALTNITLGNNVTSISAGAFQHCLALTEITIPNGVTSINDYTFAGCNSLTSVTIPVGVTSIGYYAFACQNLDDVYYGGTKAEWNNITIGGYNPGLSGVKMHYNCTSHEDVNNNGYCDNCDESFVVNSGNCGADGDNVTYELYSNGDLIISGEGTIADESFGYLSDDGFSYSLEIKNVVIENGVTGIGDEAFTLCKNITSVTIPGSVKSIGYDAFGACTSLKNVIIENGVESIGEIAFMDCYSLTSITIPESVTSIGIGAFAWSIALESIIVDENNEYYTSYNGVLFNKDKTELICYPAGSKETSYVVPDGVTSIVMAAFGMCQNLESVVIADSVTSIDESTFAYCEALKEVTIGRGITNLGYICEGCEAITTVTIPSSVTSIERYVFSDCVELETVYYGGTKSQWNAIVIAENNDPLYSATIVYAICEHEDADKDSYCDNCDEIFVVDSGNCGADGDNVTYTLYSNGYLVISGTGAIANDSFALSSYNFNFASEIKNVVIENGVTSIGEQAFWDCENLVSVTIPDSVTSIDYGAFLMCDSLTSVTIPGSVKSIGHDAFGACTSLANVIIENGVESIGEVAFMDCWSLTSITIPASVKSIEMGAFAWTFALENITVDENNEYYSSDSNGVLFNKDKTELICYPAGKTETSYVIPDSVTSLSTPAFGGCKNLTEIVISDSVTSIGEYAFAECALLESVTIGSGLTNVGECIFEGCKNLKDIYFNGTEDEWNNFAADILDGLEDVNIHCLVVPHTHTPGEWEVVTEATYEADGKKVQKCTGCGEVVAEEIIPQLVKVIVSDEKTGVALEFDSSEYDGEVEVSVEETFDGKAFEIINESVGSSKATIFDISMTLDDTAIQPNGKITVKIPLPEGYDADLCVIYYLNTENGTIEAFETKYVDGYLVFETDHFSYYAVVEVAETVDDDCSCNCHKSGFAGFIWKIILFFNKLFKTNKICSCGISHY